MKARLIEDQVELEIPEDTELQWVFRRLRSGATADDAYFDRIYPDWVQDRSRIHWTPLPVVRRAVGLLSSDRPDLRILDVGSGAGKFCLAGAMLSEARFFGIEQRPHFVRLCHQLVHHYRIPRVSFLYGNMEDLDWSRFDAAYLYNPFQEFKTPYQRIDSSIEVARPFFERYVQAVETKLAQVPPGFGVVTYHGFGGRMPAGFRLVLGEFCFRGPLEYWIKKS